MKQKAILIFMALCMAFPGTGFTAAGKEQVAVTAAQESTASGNTKNNNSQGKETTEPSVLTGEPISSELAKQRPIAVMFPIDKEAQPQYGLSNVDVFYEISEEGI